MTVPFRSVALEFSDARLTATNREGAWVVEAVGGWYGGVGVKGDRTARLGHGDFFTPNRRTGRALTLNLLWTGEPVTRDRVARSLSGLFPDGEEGSLTAEVGDLSLTATGITLDGEVSVAEVGTVGVRAQIPLHASDPFLYSPWRETNLKPIGAGVGLEYPAFTRTLGKGQILTYGTAIDTTEWVWNDGNADAFPRFRVVADAPGGFSVGLGDRRVTYPWATYPDMPVVIDMAGSLTVSGVDQSHLLGARDWASVAPQSIETPRFEFLQGGSGFCVVSHRDTYL